MEYTGENTAINTSRNIIFSGKHIGIDVGRRHGKIYGKKRWDAERCMG